MKGFDSPPSNNHSLLGHATIMLLSSIPIALASVFVLPTLAAPAGGLLKRAALPAYALTYAPYTYLQSGEAWLPSDVATHVKHMSVEYNFKNVSTSVSLETLNTFNSSTYLTSYDNVETNPAWLTSTYGKTNAKGYSAAPATIIAVEKNGFVDVFYFYFYSYNHGSLVLGSRVDNHVGDWEHSMVSSSLAVTISPHGSLLPHRSASPRLVYLKMFTTRLTAAVLHTLIPQSKKLAFAQSSTLQLAVMPTTPPPVLKRFTP
jgi:hypothetical protein